MPKELEIIQPFFPHDYNAQGDKEITLLLEDMGYEGYGLYWAIVEFMHRNSLEVGEERLIAGKVNEDKIKKILTGYKLFRTENNIYISERILRNKKIIENKGNKNQEAAQIRWLISAYDKSYKAEFGINPVLSKEEKQKLVDYSNQIEDFKQLIPKILKKLHKIKFDTKIGFQGRSNWLLKDDNLSQIVNGQYGDIITALKEDKKSEAASQPVTDIVSDDDINLDSITSKTTAIAITKAKFYRNDSSFMFLPKRYKELMKRFDVTKKEFNNAKI